MKSQAQTHHSTVSSARAAAFEILLRVERESSFASELLYSHIYDRMTNVDRSLMTELVMGVLRWQSMLDSQIAGNSSQPLLKLDIEVLIALRIGLYQLRFLSRVPASAAINESVELVKRVRKRSATSFVNAVLRKLSPASAGDTKIVKVGDQSLSTENIAANYAHPYWLVDRWIKAYGVEAGLKICEYNQTIPTTTIRLRSLEAEGRLFAEGIGLAPGALLTSARRIARGDISRVTALREGLFVIQDEASQLVAALVGSGTRVLDCCAAPGGKTLAIADRDSKAQIAAVELHPHRARLLRKLIGARGKKAGNIQIIAGDARKLPFVTKFDRILADVPCSGTGTLARNPEIKWRLAPADFADLQSRQIAVLLGAMDRLAGGGRLIYSTCSLEKEENEDVIEQAVSGNSGFRLLNCRVELDRLREEGDLVWPDISSLLRGPFLRTLPGVHPCDGFFAAVIERI